MNRLVSPGQLVISKLVMILGLIVSLLFLFSACAFSSEEPLTAEAVASSRSDMAAIYESDCYASRGSSVLTAGNVDDCIIVNPGADFSVAVVGDSHSAHWMPPLQTIAEQNNWEVTYFGKRGCSVGDYVVHDGDGGVYEACSEWTDKLMQQLGTGNYDAVITSSSARARLMHEGTVLKDEANEQARAAGMGRIWSKMQDFGSDVVVIVDTPYLGMNSPDCLESNLADVDQCDASYEEAVTSQPHPDVIALETTEGVEGVDMTESFCPELRTCDAYLREMVVFRDEHHMTGSFAASLVEVLEEKLKETRTFADHMSA